MTRRQMVAIYKWTALVWLAFIVATCIMYYLD
jgi:hypothetical protein